MPISVLCPSCSHALSAPDSAAGKRVKCPNCGGTMVLAGAAEEVLPRPRKPRPAAEDDADDDRPARKRPSRRKDDEEGERPRNRRSRAGVDDDEDDRDRRRAKGRGRKGRPPIPLLFAGGAVLVALIAFGLLLAFRGARPGTVVVPVGPELPLGLALPPGYTAVREPRGGFAVSLPGRIDQPKITIGGVDGSELGVYVWRGKNPQAEDRLEVNAESRRIPRDVPAGSVTDQVLWLFRNGPGASSTPVHPDDVVVQRECTIAGRPALELRLSPNRAGGVNDKRFVYYALIHDGKLLFLRFITVGKFPSDETVKTVTESFALS